ncbi:MAG: pur operon repressor [Clostridiales bacterium]|nr:pur operon repressor [Bacillota bacterium]MEE0517117.1 pur operon repressor [Anaerovoracaceae bacterium]PWL93414.1 MAG: pur operon repressor [Clostridiales bacterium]
MKRTERVGAMIQILTGNPNKPYSLQYFCDLFNAAKSSISEDIKAANAALAFTEQGLLETGMGAKGGVKFVPSISDDALKILQKEFCEKLSDPSRMLGGNFLYTSDIFFDPEFITKIASVFARKFKECKADYVATVETKGIPLASKVAYLLNLPLVIIRREAKISEGSTVSINYFSGSYDRIQRMSMSKRAIEPKSKVLIIDDFMRGGGSISGISEIVGEFNSSVVGVGVAISGIEPKKKKIDNYTSIVFLGEIDEETHTINVLPNNDIF